MKKLLLVLTAVAAIVLAGNSTAQAQAPIYAPQTLGTFTVAGSTANAVGYVIDCRKQASVTLQLQNAMSTSAVEAQTIAFSRSVDGINYSTPLQTIALVPTASATSYQVTNILSGGCGYIKINYFTNAAATAISTNTLQYAVKISAP